jgi:hypothetical protein
MEPFDYAQDRLDGIEEAGAGNPGFHPGYKSVLIAQSSVLVCKEA